VVVTACVWCAERGISTATLPVEPCDDCRALETPEHITDGERVALVAYLEARS
jgi:hypothetical protein